MSERLKIVVVGGGTAGWMSAAALAGIATEKVCDVTLVESDEIATVGVGEATVPAIKQFNHRLGLSEPEMMRQTGASFKLGIEFVNWGKLGSSYIHPFGTFGDAKSGVDFHQLWARCWKKGDAKPLDLYSFAIQLAKNNKFAFPDEKSTSLDTTFTYAYHLDAGKYAHFLRKFSEAKGVKRKEGKIVGVDLEPQSGNIEKLRLQSGEIIKGDLFVDCSGFRSMLMGKALGVEFESWKDWLLCDRAVTLPTEKTDVIQPFTRSTAKSVGWQWRIPLQHRTGNGYVFSSDHITDDHAIDVLLDGIEGKPTAEPRFLSFEAGRRVKSWHKNCVAVGLSGGFLEPLESTSIYLIQVAIFNLLNLMPNKIPDKALEKEFNNRMSQEYDRVRDFLILHYKLTEREDSAFWRYCKHMKVPHDVERKIKLFKKRGFIEQYRYGLFSPPSWLSVLIGQGGVPLLTEPMAGIISDEDALKHLNKIEEEILCEIPKIENHSDFLQNYCPMKPLECDK